MRLEADGGDLLAFRGSLVNVGFVKNVRVENEKEGGISNDPLKRLPLGERTVSELETVELVPLGCARLRMSCLPCVTSDEAVGVKWTPAPSHTDPATRVQKHDWQYLMPTDSAKLF